MFTRAKSAVRRALPKSAFARSVSVLAGGTAGAQIILLLAAPILTRLYSPEDFGLLAVYVSLLALLGVVSSLRYELAIPLPEDDVDAANLAALSLLLVVLTTVLSVAFVALFSTPVAHVLGVPALEDYLWLLPVGILFSGGYNVFSYWSIRTKRFSTIAGTKLRQALATIAIQIVGFKLGGLALLLGQLAGQSVGTAGLARPALAVPAFKKLSWRGIAQAAVRYHRFPAFTTWSGLANTAGHQLPPIMFAAFFSASAAGLYALAHRVLTLPSSLIGSAIGNVFFSHGADSYRDGRLTALYAGLQDKLVQIGLPPAILLIVFGPELFELLFGPTWRVAGNFAQWLAVGAFAGFVVSPLSMVFVILEKQDVGLMLQAFLFGARLIAILTGAWLSDLLLTVALFSLASLLGYSAYIITMTKVTGSLLRGFWVSFSVSLAYSLLAISPIAIVAFVGAGDDVLFLYMSVALSIGIILVRYRFVAKHGLSGPKSI